MRRDTDIGADMPGGISLGAALTEEIYNQGKEAVVFALLEISKKLAEQQSPPTPAPCTPSGMLYSGYLIFCLLVCYSGYYFFDSVRLRWCLSAIFLLFCLVPVLLFVPAVLHPSLAFGGRRRDRHPHVHQRRVEPSRRRLRPWLGVRSQIRDVLPDDSGSDLFIVDTNTGVAIRVSAVPNALGSEVMGLAFDPGTNTLHHHRRKVRMLAAVRSAISSLSDRFRFRRARCVTKGWQ